jgi:putative hydrolase of the HAD superfamily
VIEGIGFDADDTLWESEAAFVGIAGRVREMLAQHCAPEVLDARLLEIEAANLAIYGYGAKAFTLSLIETAIDLAGDDLTIAEVRLLLDAGKEILAHPVELRPGAEEAVKVAVDVGVPVLIITKGDLFHQESKVARSGLGDLVDHVEVVAEKDPATYRRITGRYGIAPDRFLMVGNALRSDIEPVLAIGGWAAFVPHELTWALEAHVDDEGSLQEHPRFRLLPSLVELPALLDQLTTGG